MRISVRVSPRSSSNTISWEGPDLKIRLTASPVDGAANKALIQLLAKRLDLPQRSIQIVHGATARQKIVEIAGLMSREELVERLKST